MYKSFIFILLLLAFGLFLLLTSTLRPIERWDEYTNITVVQESLEQGSLPILSYAEQPFFEKPPLWYWLTAGVSALFGEDLWVYRIVSVASLVGIVAVLWKLLDHFKLTTRNKFFAMSAFLLVAHNFLISPWGIHFSTHTYTSADLDALQIFLILLSVYSLFLIPHSKKYWYWSMAALALGFLTKGPLVLLFVALNSFFAWRYFKVAVKELIAGWTLFAAIMLPWHIWMYLRFGTDFLQSYVGYHVLDRVLTPLEGHTGSALDYFKIYFDPRLNLGVWLVILTAIWQRAIWKELATNKLFSYALISVLSILLLISLAQTKLAWYLLPVYPFQVLLLGLLLAYRKERKNS
jgi:4-amino-4-deoxy-L-arabinose transferase-like glycosyltransferase